MIVRYFETADGYPVTEALYRIHGDDAIMRWPGILTPEQVREMLVDFRRRAAQHAR